MVIDAVNAGKGTTQLNSSTLETAFYAKASAGLVGVQGEANTGVAGNGAEWGVIGQSSTGVGVSGTTTALSGTTVGVLGTVESTGGVGVKGFAVAGSGNTIGVFGQSASTSGIGIEGLETATAGTPTGVLGVTENVDVNPAMSGVHGAANTGTGVLGGSSTGAGVEGRAFAGGGTGVFGVAENPGAKPLVAQGASGQTANLQEWQNSSGSSLSVVDKAGNLGVGTATPQTTLQVKGGFSVGVTTKITSYAMTTSDFGILADAKAAALTITLPSASKVGMVVHVKKVDASKHIVTVAGTGTDKIEGRASKTLSKKYASLTLVADGNTNWYVISNAT